MHRLATVHARDNQPTNDQRRHDTAYLNKRLFYYSKVRRLIIIVRQPSYASVKLPSRLRVKNNKSGWTRSMADIRIRRIFCRECQFSAKLRLAL